MGEAPLMGATVAGLGALAVAVVGARATQRSEGSRAFTVWLGAAVVLGYTAAWVLRSGLPSVPPKPPQAWALWMAPIAWVFLLLRGERGGLRSLLGPGLVCALVLDMTVGALVPLPVPRDRRVVVTAALLVAWLAAGVRLDRRAGAPGGRFVGEAGVALVAGVVLTQGGSAQMGAAALALGAAILGAGLATRLWSAEPGDVPRACGGWPLACLLTAGVGFAGVPLGAALLLGAAWMATDVPWSPRLGPLHPRTATWGVTVACLIAAWILAASSPAPAA